VPSDGSSYSSGATVTVAGNSGSLAKTGHTFAGWCTTKPAAGAACSGIARAAASTFTITAATTLYAQWTLAAPAFTLSSSSESKTQNVAIAGYTITSTGGAIASYAISPAAPTGLTFNTSTGLLSGTPTTVQTATVYTITATNATSTATQTFALTVTLAAPAFTLSSSSESKTQNVAIAGYTISSTGGAIASYAISPAAPTGLTFNTSTGLLSGTPTTVQTATVYTITATNATSTATQTFTLTVAASCATGGVCIVGDTGPGGGKVFYVHASGTFACGATLASTCKYLEAAPTSGTAAWTDATYAWSGNMTVLIGATAQGTVIGTGLKNTEAMVTQSDGGNTASRAGTITRAYRGPNNLTDWYLPSKDELAELYAKRDTVGFSAGSYWSSSERAGPTAWRQSFGTGNQFDSAKGLTFYVRPVRAFG
jgi:hypothetical protein